MEHPITPPPELVQQWAISSPIQCSDESWAYELFIAHQAARWGADQELEACCEWVQGYAECGDALRLARRPKPPSLKEQALVRLTALEKLAEAMGHCPDDTIRRALEALPND